jgi:hypothetical protein
MNDDNLLQPGDIFTIEGLPGAYIAGEAVSASGEPHDLLSDFTQDEIDSIMQLWVEKVCLAPRH